MIDLWIGIGWADERLIRQIDENTNSVLPHGLVARIRRSHRRGPGSIPGGGVLFILHFYHYLQISTI